MQDQPLTPADYLEIIKRRKWSLVIPPLVVVIISLAVALALPSVYKSTATILIEEQEIPADFVRATVTSFAEQRLQLINQRIMSSSRLLEIINKFDLYKNLRSRLTTEEIIQKMRQDVKMEPISAEVVDRRTGRPTTVTIAFTLSYEGKDTPRKIQQVANVLASLFLQENIQVRERQTKETSEFLEEEVAKVKARLEEIEAQVAEFKKKNINTLPELLEVNINGLRTTEREIERLQEQLRSLKEREGYLQSQLANVEPMLDNPERQHLKKLRTQLVALQARFSDEHPDVIKTRDEIRELEKKLGKDKTGVQEELPDNPAYINLASQLASTRTDMESVRKQLQDLEKKRNLYQARIEATPKVEQAYKVILLEYSNTQAKYNDLMRKAMEARVAQGLEKEQKGERFTLIDPARLPEKPFKPNRMAIVLIGLVLGIGAGVGLASLREMADNSIRSATRLAQETGFPVLAALPEIETPFDRRRKLIRRSVGATVAVVMLACGLVAFHYLVMDLNVLWAKVVRRLALLV